MYKLSLWILVVVSSYLFACSESSQNQEANQTPTTENLAQEQLTEEGLITAQTEAAETATELVPLQDANFLIGTWNFGHEPYKLVFAADGSFQSFVPDDSGAYELFKSGSWKLANGVLTTPDNDAPRKVFRMGDILYIGELEVSEDDLSEMGYDSMAQYVADFGYHRQK
ncbi:MAG: hypothetical protein JJT94_13070 [Bernardetiaceae bacterium]|nr:hypothetical protein [Bernardetiaceae bacterium]